MDNLSTFFSLVPGMLHEAPDGQDSIVRILQDSAGWLDSLASIPVGSRDPKSDVVVKAGRSIAQVLGLLADHPEVRAVYLDALNRVERLCGTDTRFAELRLKAGAAAVKLEDAYIRAGRLRARNRGRFPRGLSAPKDAWNDPFRDDPDGFTRGLVAYIEWHQSMHTGDNAPDDEITDAPEVRAIVSFKDECKRVAAMSGEWLPGHIAGPFLTLDGEKSGDVDEVVEHLPCPVLKAMARLFVVVADARTAKPVLVGISQIAETIRRSPAAVRGWAKDWPYVSGAAGSRGRLYDWRVIRPRLVERPDLKVPEHPVMPRRKSSKRKPSAS